MRCPCSFHSVCLLEPQEKAGRAPLSRVGILDMVQCVRVHGTMSKLPSATLYTQSPCFPLLHLLHLSKHFTYSPILKAKNLCKQYVQNVFMNFNSYISNRWKNTKLVSVVVVMGNLHLYGSLLPYSIPSPSFPLSFPPSSGPRVSQASLKPLCC